jgi:hypothetical protein
VQSLGDERVRTEVAGDNGRDRELRGQLAQRRVDHGTGAKQQRHYHARELVMAWILVREEAVGQRQVAALDVTDPDVDSGTRHCGDCGNPGPDFGGVRLGSSWHRYD